MLLQPLQGETEHAFTVRAHRSLLSSVPDFNTRNQIVWDAWDEANGPSMGQVLAQKHFDPQRFSYSPAHCHFVEHEKFNQDGSKSYLGVSDLSAIITENNRQIADRENFHAISLGHTTPPSPVNPQPKDPEVLGFAGNYRLGMVGHEKPVFAIFGDEWHRKDKLSKVQSNPRRSVELNTLRATGTRWFDPIAALGAQAPRLAMPAKYDNTDDADIERYSVVAPAYSPGGSNTFTPGGFEQAQYGDQTPNQGGNMQEGSLSDSTIAQLVAAFSQLPEIQFIRSMPQFLAQSAGGPGAASVGSPMGAPAGGSPGPAQNGFGGGAAGGDDFTPLEDDSPMNQGNPNQVQYSAENFVDVERYQEMEAQVEHYQARTQVLENTVRQQMDTIKSLTSSFENQNRQAEDVRRRAKLEQIVSRYGIFDLDEEIQTCLYSAGSEMTSDEFDFHLDRMNRQGSRSEALSGSRIPQGVTAMDVPETQQYAALASRAHEIFNERINEGEWLDWNTCMSRAKAETTGGQTK